MSETAGRTGETTANPEVLIVYNKLKAAYALEMSTSRHTGDIQQINLSLGVLFGAARIAYRVSRGPEMGVEVWRQARINERGRVTEAYERKAGISQELDPEGAEAFVLEYGPKIAEDVGSSARARVVTALTAYDEVMGAPSSEVATEEATN